MIESISKPLEKCPFCGSRNVEIEHYFSRWKFSKKKDEWSFRHFCRRKLGNPKGMIIIGCNYESQKEAEDAWNQRFVI